MTRPPSLITAVALAALTASCAPTADGAAPGETASARPERQCFVPEQVRNFRQGGAGQVYVRVMRDEVFELNSSGGCTNLDFANRMAIVPDVAGLAGGRSCTGDWVRIVVPGSTPAMSTCRARVSKVLTAEEVAALPSAYRP